MVILQYEIYWVNLDPTIGSEIKKTRPCLVLSPNVMNRVLNTLIVAPLTTSNKDYPSRVNVKFMGKNGQVALDQMKCIDKTRIKNKLSQLDIKYILEVKNTIKEILVD